MVYLSGSSVVFLVHSDNIRNITGFLKSRIKDACIRLVCMFVNLHQSSIMKTSMEKIVCVVGRYSMNKSTYFN